MGKYFKENVNNYYDIKQDEIGIVWVAIEYHVMQNISDEKVKLLHTIRHMYKTENKGKQKKEIDIPLHVVKTIFNIALPDKKYEDNINYSKCEENLER